ncbi:MAG: TolC family protein [Isosphaeraceae bacterium]
MMERFDWLTIFILALILGWVGPAMCAAQSPTMTLPSSAQPSNSNAPAASARRVTIPAPRRPGRPSESNTRDASVRRVSIPAPRRFQQPGESDTPEVPAAPVAQPVPNNVQAVALAQPLPAATAPPAAQPSPIGVPTTNESSPTSATALAPKAGELALLLPRAPMEKTDFRFPINLATALRLSDARPLIVAAAQASVWVAEAQLTRAKVLWVPTLMFGANYTRHDGGGPDINKGVMTAASVNYFMAGAGAAQYVAVTDVIFEPLVARQNLNSRHFEIQSAKNDALLQTANAYFKVHQYRGMYAGDLYCVERGHDLIERIAQLSKELVPVVEVDRARNLVADLEQRATIKRQEWRVNSANLTQVLRLDPRSVVDPMEHDHLQITLIDPASPLPDLHKIALTNRPEIAAQRAQVLAAEARIRREKARPFLPIVMINGFQTPGMYIQAGVFGLGPNSSLNNFIGRNDDSFQLIWQFDAFGVGNLARVKEQRGEQSKVIVDLYRTQDMVAKEVTAAQARLQSATARVSQADRAVRTAIITFNGNFEGLRQTTRFGDILVLVNRPQEAVYALELMQLAFNEYFTTVAEYNSAEFELFHALGYPAREIAVLNPPGNIEQVDTARPAYLPPVGNGPPPATD